MTFPRPSIKNCVSTLLAHGNTRGTINLDRIARFQGFDPVALEEEFNRQSMVRSLTPENYVEGK